jgi:prepilin-type processing-associated H-X9-DG protein
MGFLWDATVSGNPPSLVPPAAIRINNQTGGDPNGRSWFFARPSSFHPGLVNAAFCDGHTRTISQDIDYLVFCLLMTPRGSDAQQPGATPRNASAPNDPAFVPAIFRTTQCDKRDLD